MNSTTKKAWLLLEDSTLFEGKSFGSEGTSIGEVVFSTSMVGYEEAITDPNYYGQILAQTFPLIGNYGTNAEDMTSDKSYLKGYIVREWCEVPSNYRCEEDINSFLNKMNIIGIYDIDVRKLTKILREKGALKAMITSSPITDINASLKEISEYSIKDAVKTVTENFENKKVSDGNKYNVGVLNLGTCSYLTDALGKKDCNVTLLSPETPIEDMKVFDGIVLSEGPGNPYENEKIIENIKALIASKTPLLGIGLGHQLLAIANGFNCKALLHGHRGSSQPVVDLKGKKTYITSQNHRYYVDNIEETVAEIRFKNVNDLTCEGLNYKNIPAISVQFRPSVDRSRQDTAFVYDEFLNSMKGR